MRPVRDNMVRLNLYRANSVFDVLWCVPRWALKPVPVCVLVTDHLQPVAEVVPKLLSQLTPAFIEVPFSLARFAAEH